MKAVRRYLIQDETCFETWWAKSGDAPSMAQGTMDAQPYTRAEMAEALRECRHDTLTVMRLPSK